ncbi:MAG: sigma-54-dependent Fis family transcriptional regulator [Candidatus Cloacimonetes bacterium]|nr:sigma-54-dependent Fis family transcriptional regulator [Candidatus Cloacimonadota bacterium]
MESVLIIEDEKTVQYLLSLTLEEAGYSVQAVADGKAALSYLKKNQPDLILLDIGLPDMDGINVLRRIREKSPEQLVIMVTGFKSLEFAIEAMKAGAYDYITKPFHNEELILVIRKALEMKYLSNEVQSLQKRLYEHPQNTKVMGDSAVIQKILKQVKLIASTDMSVIIQGRSGTGKEVIAQLIHEYSKRSSRPLVAVDCGAIPETLVESELYGHEKGSFTGADSLKIGKFEQAEKSTLLLDEITNLPLESQRKLLRAIEERKIQRVGGKKPLLANVRLLATTNIDIQEAVKKGEFRDDLYHRLNEFMLYLPALQDRKDDIPVLAREFLREANFDLNKKVKDFTPEGMKLLQEYPWPGNVRELKNVVKRAVLLSAGDMIEPEDLHLNLSNSVNTTAIRMPEENDYSLEMMLQKVEADMIHKALLRTGGNKTRAARLLKINRKALYRKLQKKEHI